MPVGAGRAAFAIGLGLAALIFGGRRKKTPKRIPFEEPIETPETDDDILAIDMVICGECVTAANEDLQTCVALALFPEVPWPPIEGDHPTVLEVWAVIGERVQAFFAEPGPFCARFEPTDGPIEPIPAEPQPEPLPLPPEPIPAIPEGPIPFNEGPAAPYPPETPTIHLGGDGKHFPTPGTFYRIKGPNADPDFDAILSIARAAVGSGLAMAGEPIPLAQIPTSMVLAMKDLIACSPWNEALYGTTTQSHAGGGLGMNPVGTGISMLPRHVNVLGRLQMGSVPARNIRLNGSKLGSGSSHAQLWIPAINLELLADAGVVTTEGMEWSDGSSTLNPPPAVMARGVDVQNIAPPGGRSDWGC